MLNFIISPILILLTFVVALPFSDLFTVVLLVSRSVTSSVNELQSVNNFLHDYRRHYNMILFSDHRQWILTA